MTDDSGLLGSPLLFIFQDVSSIPRQRRLLEFELGLRVIESQFHPPHEHHGLVKYDGGGTVVALNLFAERKFRLEESDGVTVVYRTRRAADIHHAVDGYGTWTGNVFTDRDGHLYIFEPGQAQTEVAEFRLAVADIGRAVDFYSDLLGLPVTSRDDVSARIMTGTVDLVLQQGNRALDGRAMRQNTCLLVFYVGDVVGAEKALSARGLAFSTSAGFSNIGGTARFHDPNGHAFCLYEPSPASLTWGSGEKIKQLIARQEHDAPVERSSTS
jgi:catechol 2,3-dioxygenase-like lactoylglutathione lyase family enzyme